jgi:aminomethyltransferase
MLLNDAGGIEDDVIVYRFLEDELLIVVNASNQTHDAALLADVAIDVSDRWAMLALQGPLALDVAAELLDADVRDLPPFRSRAVAFDGQWMLVATTGYTGERGCEIVLPPEIANAVWDMLLADERVSPCGLGARDTLRLEACYPLHGNDIGPDTDPISAGLGFAAPAGLHESIDAIREGGPARRLVPVRVTERGIPRPGTTVHAGDEQVGEVTSGTMSPVLRTGIALAWIDARHAATGTALELEIRGSRVPAEVVSRPFVRGSL